MGLYSNEIAKKITIFIPPKKTDMKINFFNNIKQTKPEATTSILEFLNNVKLGTWRDKIEPINAETDPDKVKELKNKTLPYVTISGTFNQRNDSSLIKHSGFICLDLDKLVDLDKEWEKIINDPYTFGAFKSASGRGIAVLVKIKTNKHKESFLSLESYYLEKYSINIDKACKDISRPRYVSYDPETFVNQEAETFDKFVKIKKAPKKVNYNFNNVVIGSNDIEHIIKQAQERSVDLCSEYEEWIKIGFSLAAEFGEGGRGYFHALSSIGANYDPQKCDKQYDNCIKSDGSGVTIATLFHYAKENNIEIQTKRTKEIARAVNIRKGGRDSSLENVKKLITETFEDVDEEDLKVAEKAFNSNFDIKKDKDVSIDEKLLIYLKANHKIRKNEITQKFEDEGVVMTETHFNTISLQANIFFNIKTSTESIIKLVDSFYTESYNPIMEYFDKNRHRKPTGEIQKLCDSLIGVEDQKQNFKEYKEFFVKKWLVGLVQTVYEKHSPLVLVLLGPQGCGKTHFFRHLIPESLRPYYGEKEPGGDKDFDLLLCQKWIVSNDEWSGKTRKEASKFKALTSRQTFDLRKPYGRGNETFRRLAVLCGTTNDPNILNDSTGNRRIIPIEISEVNKKIYNSVNEKDLIVEIFHLYNEGNYNTELTADNIKFLNEFDKNFKEESTLSGLISKYYKLPEEMQKGDPLVKLSPTDLLIEIEALTEKKLNYSPKIIRSELKGLGFKDQTLRKNNQVFKGYKMSKRVFLQEEKEFFGKEGGNLHVAF